MNPQPQDPLDTLPTCWYCPLCGSVENSKPTSSHWKHAAFLCHAEMVEVPIIPPGSALDPVRLRDIFSLLGYSISVGRRLPSPLDPPGYFMVRVAPIGEIPYAAGYDVLVLRDQRETTDA